MLRRAGIGDVVVFERADEVGGTWRDNTYPGCACDVPSALYSFTFAPNPAWGRLYARQAEIQTYARRVAREHGVEEHVVTGADVLSADWDEHAQRWLVRTTRGDWRARALISATGPWSEPVVPDLPGLDEFAGTVFHSSRWDHGHDLTGRRVAVLGTGASAVQFVPRIQPQAERLTVFQRTAQWVLPKPDRGITPAEQALYRRLPADAAGAARSDVLQLRARRLRAAAPARDPRAAAARRAPPAPLGPRRAAAARAHARPRARLQADAVLERLVPRARAAERRARAARGDRGDARRRGRRRRASSARPTR